MNTYRIDCRTDQQGGARLKLIIFIVVFGLIVYAGYLYVPVAIDAYYFRDMMQNKANLAAVQDHDTTWVTDQIKMSEHEYNVPENAVITAAQKDGRMEVRVQFTRPISTPIYTYNYEFDYTVKSGTFLTVK
jgi:hypothetical protein